LNGAFAGKPKNESDQGHSASEVGDDIPVQLGGGIRDLDTIERCLDDGLSYVIIGTAAVKNPGFLHDACVAFPGHIIVGLDAKDGKVATDGWSKLTGHDVVDLAKNTKTTASNRLSIPISAVMACSPASISKRP
jgi:phosphoribosylformimino-5-aminoimidazole carboxamide ribotide isomerase